MTLKKTLILCSLLSTLQTQTTELPLILHDKNPYIFLHPTIEKSIEIASQWYDMVYHQHPWRKGLSSSHPHAKIPLISHATNVAMMIKEADWDTDTIAAAFLSYTLNTPNKFGEMLYYDAIANAVGKNIANIVQDITEARIEDNGIRTVWRQKKEQHIEKLSHTSDQAIAVMLADKIHDIWTINQALECGKELKEMEIRTDKSDLLWFYEEALNVSYAYNDIRLRKLRLALRKEINRFCELTSLPTRKQVARQKREQAIRCANAQESEQLEITASESCQPNTPQETN